MSQSIGITELRSALMKLIFGIDGGSDGDIDSIEFGRWARKNRLDLAIGGSENFWMLFSTNSRATATGRLVKD